MLLVPKACKGPQERCSFGADCLGQSSAQIGIESGAQKAAARWPTCCRAR